MSLFPLPSERLFDCCWLPRILAKAKAFQSGQLDPAYKAFFCGPGSVDAYFLEAFNLSRDDILSAAELSETALKEWFNALPQNEAHIKEWNELAPRLGTSGMPMEERLKDALANRYTHLAGMHISSVFEMLEADETQA